MATKKPTAIVKTKDNRPETGRGGKRNFPSCLPDLSSDEDRALVSQLLTEVLVEYRQPKVKSKEKQRRKAWADLWRIGWPLKQNMLQATATCRY